MKTELMVILEQKRLEKEGERLQKIFANEKAKVDEEGNSALDPANALVMQTAIAINNHQQKTINWVLDREPIKTTL